MPSSVEAQLAPLAGSAGGYVLAVVLGLLWGSFANVCIYRLPAEMSIVKPDSHCFACKAPIRWYDNVPLFAWLWLRGKCRHCGATFSTRYIFVEALTGALFGVAWWFTMGTGGMYDALDVRALRFCIYAAFLFTMVVITFIDLDHKLILDKITFPAVVVFYGASFLDHRWYDGLIGIGIGFGVPWLIGEIYYRVRGREGMGLGDAKLLAVVGALFGWKGVVVSLFGGSIVGSVVGIVALARAKKETHEIMTTELPFGPFLAAGAVFYLFAEPWIELYFRLL